jgi:hypothetical protein
MGFSFSFFFSRFPDADGPLTVLLAPTLSTTN